MRVLLVLSLLLPLAAFGRSQYQPLEFLAGHCWKGSFPGGKASDEHCFAWVYGGKFLRDTHTVRTTGRPDAQGESIYFWNSSSRQIEYLYIESGGGFSRGPLSVDGSALVFPDTAYVENGKTQTYRSRWQPSGAAAYDVVTEFKVGETWTPGFKVHMERQP